MENQNTSQSKTLFKHSKPYVNKPKYIQKHQQPTNKFYEVATQTLHRKVHYDIQHINNNRIIPLIHTYLYMTTDQLTLRIQKKKKEKSFLMTSLSLSPFH